MTETVTVTTRACSRCERALRADEQAIAPKSLGASRDGAIGCCRECVASVEDPGMRDYWRWQLERGRVGIDAQHELLRDTAMAQYRRGELRVGELSKDTRLHYGDEIKLLETRRAAERATARSSRAGGQSEKRSRGSRRRGGGQGELL